MLRVCDIAKFLELFAPRALAESWDNVGLLVGDSQAHVERVMTCLTITPVSAREAIEGRANLIVAHHPLPFRPLKQLTTETAEGRMLLDLIAANVAVYSPHTAFDSAAQGINQQLAEGLQLQNIRPLVSGNDGELGSGRWGELSQSKSLLELVGDVKTFLRIPHAQWVGSPDSCMQTVGVACGSAGDFLNPARELGCDCLVTGEVRFHTALEAEATEIAIVLAGHFASERFGVESLARVLAAQFPEVQTWASREERDPIGWA